jgi:hypothetical protein
LVPSPLRAHLTEAYSRHALDGSEARELAPLLVEVALGNHAIELPLVHQVAGSRRSERRHVRAISAVRDGLWEPRGQLLHWQGAYIEDAEVSSLPIQKKRDTRSTVAIAQACIPRARARRLRRGCTCSGHGRALPARTNRRIGGAVLVLDDDPARDRPPVALVVEQGVRIRSSGGVIDLKPTRVLTSGPSEQ